MIRWSIDARYLARHSLETRSLKYAYMDEAGTSEREQVSVVLSVIVDADAQWRSAEAEIIEAVKTIPRHLLEGFVYSAKVVYNDPKFRRGWADEDRFAFLYRMMSIPRKLRIPICFGFQRRGNEIDPNLLITPPGVADLKAWQMDHLSAFMECTWEIEDFMKANTPPNEACSIKAECMDMEPTLNKALRFMKRMPVPGVGTPIVQRIIDKIEFLEKDDSPMLWLADSCAYAFRRFLAGQKYGDEAIETVVGHRLEPNDWAVDSRSATFRF